MLFEVAIAVKALYTIKRLFVLRVSTSNNIQITTVKNADGVKVSGLCHLSNLCPSVFGDFVNFAFLSRLVRVL